ncbi:uncharacterized protein LOC101894231 isoform X2 [Musca domestica]|uniref:Uncharacterized protein LOC101894231 isoform X2 n=1 Tax=Musca domestica TaxID=7370 RepID=A0A9J7DLR8_MUSDO|nr:uncharacterized protein LOC101894231 isoform X2 [Musca domestica]
MAAINPEDLEKLKKFIDFVSANPLILNVPQLGFMKRFIEKFGGKVPEGEYQMPAGGKCPFGGDAKTETKTQPPPSSTQDADEAEPVVEEESEESEVELDMEETDNMQLLEPNVLYLDERPPKIVKQKRLAKKETRKKKKPKPVRKTKKENRLKKVNIKLEAAANETLRSGDDPLCTASAASEQEIKMEAEEEETEASLKMETEETSDHRPALENALEELHLARETKCELRYDSGEEDQMHEANKDDSNDNEDYVDSDEDFLGEEEVEEEDGNENDMDEDDEPLIILTRKKGRPRKYPLKEEGLSVRIPRMEQCREICKQKCTQKFSQEQRQAMCEYFWSLSSEEKKQFIRRRTKTKRYTRLKRKNAKSRGNNCCYYLNVANENGRRGTEEGEEIPFIRVCRKYFESTLCITNYMIKKALDGYEPEMETKPPGVMEGGGEETKASKKQEDTVQQYLDPETGDLITIDPNEEKKKRLAAAASMSTPKKRVRRKPGDPLPEHFPKPIKCAERCIHKCHTKFTEEERKQICDTFWSMDYKRRKDFILARIETKEVETQTTPEFRKSNRPPRAYHTRFFLRSAGLQGENKRVCKHFMMATLAINRQFITNAIDFADKTTGFYAGADRRGHNGKSNKIGPERKQTITDHISSYPTWLPNKKSKTRYLHHSLNIKRMYKEYKDMCVAQDKKYVSNHYYYRSFHEDFRLAFLSNPEPKRGGGFMKSNPNVSHYTGNEPGGMWLDPRGERLDLSHHRPWESLIKYPKPETQPATLEGATTATNTNVILSTNPSNMGNIFLTVPPPSSEDSSNIGHVVQQQNPEVLPHNPAASFSFTQSSLSYAHLIDSSGLFCQPPPAAVGRHDFSSNLYEVQNLSQHAHGAASTTSSAEGSAAGAAAALFRKL